MRVKRSLAERGRSALWGEVFRFGERPINIVVLQHGEIHRAFFARRGREDIDTIGEFSG